MPATVGNALHALFFDLVAQKDWVMAHELHAARAEKPFAVSPLQGEFTTTNGFLSLSDERVYWIRLTSIENRLSALLLELKDSITEVQIFGESFRVTRAVADASEHPWAGQTTFEDMYNSIVASPQPWQKKIRMSFFSPTTFRSGRKNIPLPVPRLVFLHLSQKWNAFSRINLGSNIADIIDERLSLSRHSIRTNVLDFGTYKQIGFVGECEFLIHGENDIPSRVFHLLAKFAFYAGIGHKTTMGMGQARLVTDRISQRTE
jgi:CRISPR-associated endoribonuclease Cas6